MKWRLRSTITESPDDLNTEGELTVLFHVRVFVLIIVLAVEVVE